MANRFLNNITINDEYTLPSADGTADQIITTDGAGQLSFADLSSIDGAASNFVYFDVKNETGSTILKGKGVMAVGTDGNSGHILIDEMVADGTVEPKYFLGVLEEDIANGAFARAISFGQLSQFDTRGQNGETWADGQVLWCDPANNGDFTITEPDGPNVKIAAAFILNSSTNGKIQVRVQANEGIHDLHDTKITSQVDGDVLVWDNTTGVWFNDSTLNVDYTNGRVGIGTTSPSQELHINDASGNSSIRLSGGAANNETYEIGQGITAVSNGGFGFYNVAEGEYTMVFQDSTRNVGIGTTSPSNKLHVKSDGNEGIFMEGTGNGHWFNFKSGLSNLWSMGAQTGLMGWYNRTDSTYKMVITDDGNVGIGTTSPGEKLSVNGNIESLDTFILNYANNGIKWQQLFDGANSWNLRYYNGTAWSGSAITVKADGNVGIGNTDPDAILDVGVSIHQSATGIDVAGGEGGANIIGLTSATNHNWLPFTDGSNYLSAVSHTFRNADHTTDWMYISSDGNVGIGTNGPNARLEIKSSTEASQGGNLLLNRGADKATHQNYLIFQSNGLADEIYIGTPVNSSNAIIGARQGDMIFQTGSYSERMRIDSSGNVGIGTTSPGARLDVQGAVTIKGSGTGTSGSLAIQDDYSGENHLGNIGWIRSSGGVYLSYGLKQENSAEWKSTYANFSGERAYAKLDNNEFSMAHAPAQDTAVGTAVTGLTEKFKFYLNTGVLQLNSYSAGILSTSSNGTVGIASSGDLPGGPYLPLSAGDSYPLTGNLVIEGNAKVLRLKRDANQSWIQYVGSNDDFIIRDETDSRSAFVAEGGGNVYFPGGNVGIGTTSPVETLSVPSTKGVMLGFKRFYSGSGTVPAGVGSSYALIANLNEEQGTTLTTQHQYKFYLTTTGTGTYNSSVYIVYRNSADTAWDVHRVSSTGLTSNHPELTISGNNALIYNDHPSSYGVFYRVETSYTGQAKTSPEIFGSDYMWTRDFNNLHYMDGLVGIGTTNPNTKLHIQNPTRINDNYGLMLVENTATGDTATTNTGINIKNYSGTSQFMQWEENGLRIGSRLVTNNGLGHVIFTAGADSEKMRIQGNGNVGIGTTNPDYKLDVSGSGRFSGPINAQGGLYFRGDANMGFIPYPIGGQLRSDLSPATGYVMIKLPTDIGNQPDDMISFHVDLYDYTTNEMISVYIGGYIYTNGSGGNAYWYNCTSIITTKEDDKDFNVRFGWDGTNYYVAIGETTSTWQHPSIIVRDFQCSFRGSIEHYIDGWNVSIGTSALVGVDETQSGNLPKASSASLSTASSLYDLIPNGAFTTTYAFTSTAGTWSEVMEGNDVITSSGTYSIQVFVDDNGVGGTQYDEYYSGTMSWFAPGTNDDGGGAISEIVLHRAGHAANTGVIYLRTRETTNAETNKLKLEVMSNKTYTGASNLVFKFVRLI